MTTNSTIAMIKDQKTEESQVDVPRKPGHGKRVCAESFMADETERRVGERAVEAVGRPDQHIV